MYNFYNIVATFDNLHSSNLFGNVVNLTEDKLVYR